MSAITTRSRPALAALALAALVVLCAAAGPANASTARVLGKTERTPEPSCPKTPCEAVGSVTGFQLVADGTRAPFKARQNSWIVGWAIDVSQPKKSQHNFFADFYRSNVFGTVPTARIAVIKRREGRNYKLKSQSPVVPLSTSLGSRQTFTLSSPLKIRKGEFLALSIPTWASAFAVNLSSAQQRLALEPGGGQVLGHGQHQGRQAAAEGPLDPHVRLRLQDRTAPVLGLLRPPLALSGDSRSRAASSVARVRSTRRSLLPCPA